MAKKNRPKTYRQRQRRIPLTELDLPLPEELSLYLTEDEALLLKAMLGNYSIRDIMSDIGLDRQAVMEKLIDLGRALEAFELSEKRIFPEEVPSADYLRGWNACKRFIRRLINDKLNWRKTVEIGDSRTPREGEGAIPEGEDSAPDFKETEDTL